MKPARGVVATLVLRTLCLLLALVVPAGAKARTGSEFPISEYAVKAAFLYKFTSYVEWPAGSFDSAESPLMIGVFGAEQLADELRRMVAGRSVGGRHYVVRELRRNDSVAGLHIVFIGRSGEERLREVIGAIRGQTTLTVTETTKGLDHGSIINFVVVEHKVRFDIGVSAAEAARLKISARLLAVARKVIGRPT